jgi:hypothetical protein
MNEQERVEAESERTAELPLSDTDRALILKELDQSLSHLLKALEGVTEEEAQEKPSAACWSIVEIVEHLTLSEAAFVDLLSPRLLAMNPSERQRDKVKWTDEGLLTKVSTPESKAVSPELVLPASRFGTLAEAVEAFGQIRQRTRDLAESYRVDVRLRVFPHPALGLLDGVQWLLFQAAHCVRHAKQIERMRSAKSQAVRNEA